MPAVDFSRQGLADLRTGLGDLVRELFRSNQQSSNQAFPTNPNRMNPILGPIFSPYFREEQYLRDLSQVGNPMYRPPQGLQSTPLSYEGVGKLREARGLPPLGREYYEGTYLPSNPNRMNPIQGALNQRLGPIFSPYFRELANTPTGQPPGAQEQYLRDLSQVGNPMYRPPQGLQSTPLSYEGVGKLREARGLPPLGREYYEDTYLPYGI